jgi:outer membrane protein insertion porin family
MMLFRRFAWARWSSPLALALVVLLAAGAAHAFGEQITDVRVLGNVRTGEDTVRSLAGVDIGDSLDQDTLATVRERLNTSGLFADVNVWWENHNEGVRVNIAVKDKFPWAPVPTGSWSANNKSLGLVFVHGNLFGRGKQLVLGGRVATVDSGAVVAYRDPALFGTWMYWEVRGLAQRQSIPEYDVHQLAPISPWRTTTLDAFGIQPVLGIAWFRRVKTQIGWRGDRVRYVREKLFDPTTGMELPEDVNPRPDTIRDGAVGMGRAALAFDWRAREHAVMSGVALSGNFDYASPAFGSDYTFWRAASYWEHGIRIFRRHNFIYSAAAMATKDTPHWWDPTAGGNNLRGYLLQQYRGDTYLNFGAEYHFPLFSIGSLDFRALAFYDVAAIWWRHLPTTMSPDGTYLVRESDQRTFNPAYVEQGFSVDRSVRNNVGGGLRFFLRSVAVPLVGFDAGYGLESQSWRFILLVGA